MGRIIPYIMENMFQTTNQKMTQSKFVEIVELAIKKLVMFHRFLYVYQAG